MIQSSSTTVGRWFICSIYFSAATPLHSSASTTPVLWNDSSTSHLHLRRLCSYGCTSRKIFVSIFYAWNTEKRLTLYVIPKRFICIYYACTIEKWLIYHVVPKRFIIYYACTTAGKWPIYVVSAATALLPYQKKIHLQLRFYDCWKIIHLQYTFLQLRLYIHLRLLRLYYWKMTYPLRRSKRIHLHLLRLYCEMTHLHRSKKKNLHLYSVLLKNDSSSMSSQKDSSTSTTPAVLLKNDSSTPSL